VGIEVHEASGPLARYDAVADWYDTNARPPPETLAALVDLLGPGHGRCLDLGCGTGHYLSTIRSTGREPFGIDLSWGQLRHAWAKEPKVVHGDGAILPFPTGSFATVAAIWITTDVDDLGAVLAEAARVLDPGGTLVVLGVHPCFNGPCVETLDDGGRLVHPTYRQAGWHEASPWWGPDGIRRRVGMRHVPLADYFNAVIGAGFALERVVEPRQEPIPFVLGLRARRA
jgi:SAM-dependent methyltransferase